MFQANAFQVNAFQIGNVPGSITPVVVDEARSKGGWDPYYYKRRVKSRPKREEVERFLAETAQLDAPEAIEDAAEVAREAAKEYLALADKALQREAQRLLSEALDRIDAFYEAVRMEAERRRIEDEEDDDDFLLLN
jgi:hypothetical protein